MLFPSYKKTNSYKSYLNFYTYDTRGSSELKPHKQFHRSLWLLYYAI